MSDDAERIIDLYRRHAGAWTAARRRQQIARPLEAGWLARWLGLLPSRPDVLDLGCGSGHPIGAYLAARGCEPTGVDAAPEMIALWQAALPGRSWHVGDMRTLALGRSFDGILAWNSFFHLCPDDQRRMFPVFRRHAAPGAALMFTSGTHHGTAMGTLEGEPLYHASLDAAEYRALLAAHGFAVVAHAIEDPTCDHHTIWLAQLASPGP